MHALPRVGSTLALGLDCRRSYDFVPKKMNRTKWRYAGVHVGTFHLLSPQATNFFAIDHFYRTAA